MVRLRRHARLSYLFLRPLRAHPQPRALSCRYLYNAEIVRHSLPIRLRRIFPAQAGIQRSASCIRLRRMTDRVSSHLRDTRLDIAPRWWIRDSVDSPTIPEFPLYPPTYRSAAAVQWASALANPRSEARAGREIRWGSLNRGSLPLAEGCLNNEHSLRLWRDTWHDHQ